MEKLQNLKEVEALLAASIARFKSECVAAVSTAPSLPGVQVLSSSPNICVVSAKSLFSGGEYVLTPEYYSQDSQAQLVQRFLSSAVYSWQVEEKIQSMCESKRVKLGNVTHRLNPHTVAALSALI